MAGFAGPTLTLTPERARRPKPPEEGGSLGLKPNYLTGAKPHPTPGARARRANHQGTASLTPTKPPTISKSGSTTILRILSILVA